MSSEPLIRNISDTARWAAVFRADESERPDALFRDPFARRLAGDRGKQIADAMFHGRRHAWSWVTRTWSFDQFITASIGEGVDLVLNLAAGLDARPYRMALPASLTWVEVDLPELLDYKEEVLADAQPACKVERVRLDLANVDARRDLFQQLGGRCTKALIITEGLLIYLSPAEVAALARDLAAQPSFQRWIIDIASPGLLHMLAKNAGTSLKDAGAPFKFGPPEGPHFFEPFGWKPLEVRGHLKTAARLKRLPFFLRLLSLLPESTGRQGTRPWGGVCLLGS